MKDDELQLIDIRAVEFSQQFNELLSAFPNYRLDGSWESVGVVDSILYFLRGKEQFSEEERQLVFFASCYIARIVVEGWRKFPGNPTVGVFAEESPRLVLKITLRGGHLLSIDQEHSIELFKSIEDLLKKSQKYLGVYRGYKLHVSKNSNLLSPFISGVLSGASPACSGSLSNIPEEKQIEQEAPIAAFISSSLARSIQRKYPLEEVFSISDYFQPFATLPPDYDDGPPLVRYTVPAFQRLSQDYPDVEKRIEIFEKLAGSSDDLLSKVGVALRFGMCQVVPSGNCATLVEAQGLASSRLRAAVHATRLQQEFEGSWAELLKMERLDLAQHYFCIDTQLGLSPLLSYPVVSQLHRLEYEPLLKMLSTGEVVPVDAIRYLYQMLDPQVVEFQLQFARLFLIHNELNEVRKLLQIISKQLDYQLADLYFHQEFLRVQLMLMEGSVEEATELLAQVVKIETFDKKSRTDALALYLELLLNQGKHELIVEVANDFLEKLPDSLSPHLYLIAVNIARDSLFLVEDSCQWLYKRIANHPEVFSLILTLQRRLAVN